ncbi:MAG: aldose epimerase family protein [Bacteroidia bacterium]
MIYILQNSNGVEAHISSYGCMLTRFFTPNRNGNMASIVLGLDHEADYRKANTNYGGIVGRYANRIGGGGFYLDNVFYPLPSNLNNDMHLHGGYYGFDQKEWNVIAISKHAITLQYRSQDGEEGYPGNLDAEVRYELKDDNALHFTASAKTDKATVVSFSHHAYFNLSGSFIEKALNHRIQISASHYLSTDKQLLPTQKVAVDESPFDFRFEKTLGQDINTKHPDLEKGAGYDHCFILDKNKGPVATLHDPESGRTLTLETNQPGLQLYTANFLSPETVDFQETPLQPYHAVCLEPQQLPDAPNRLDFPSPILRPGELYEHVTIFRPGIR